MGILGGIIGPTVEEEAVIAAEKSTSYLSFTIAGISIVPIADVSATAAPVMPAKNMDATTLTIASPPRIEPTKIFENLIRRFVIPPLFIREPASIKKGTAINGKESVPENIFCGIIRRGISGFMNKHAREEIPRQNATGIPIIRKSKKDIPKSQIID